MKKDDFLRLYNSLTIKELCKELNCSPTVIYSLIKKYNLPKKGNAFRDYSYLKKERKIICTARF